MESNKYYQSLPLSEVSFLPAHVQALLSEYNIYTLGEFLSATKGLTNTIVFAGLENREEIINKLLQFIPVDIVEMYMNYSEEHPTGLLILPKNESNTEKIG